MNISTNSTMFGENPLKFQQLSFCFPAEGGKSNNINFSSVFPADGGKNTQTRGAYDNI